MIYGLLLVFTANAHAMWRAPQMESVPISRLLKNIQVELKSTITPEKRAALEYRIGRLHSMAYAEQSEEIPIIKETGEPVYHPATPFPGIRMATRLPADKGAAKHLHQAIVHLQRALDLAPNDLAIELGLGWCLEQSGDKPAAINHFRKIVSSNAAASDETLGFDSVISREAAGYLVGLLDPGLLRSTKDSSEITSLLAREKKYSHSHPVTPIIVPLAGNLSRQELTAAHSVRFDADGLQLREFQPWLTPKAGWLVWDPKHTGKIDSGRQLFGSVTFWLFWNNGYEALQALDDNHDGELEGKELDGLAIWQDLSGDGISQPGEVKPLSDWGIVSISYHAEMDSRGMWYSPAGATFASGETRPTYDLILTPTPLDVKFSPITPHPMLNHSIPLTGGVR